MAPSVADVGIEETPVTVFAKSLPERAITVEAVSVDDDSSVKPPAPIEEVVTVEAPKTAEQTAVESIESKPKIRRIIDEEGGTTTARVSAKVGF